MTNPSGATDQEVPVPMDECEDNSASTDGILETLPSIEASPEVLKSVSPSHHSPVTTEEDMVLASNPTDA